MENVMFLGAGASAAEGAPLQNDLFARYFEAGSGRLPWDPVLRQFFSRLFGLEVAEIMDKYIFPTFEEVLGILDLAIQKQQCFYGYKEVDDLITIRKALVALLINVLDHSLRERKNLHRSMIRSMKRDRILNGCSFISTNYDILIDNALGELIRDNIYLDYGISFGNSNHPDAEDFWEAPRGFSINLIKVHGSLNWLLCPSCNKIYITPYSKGAARLYDRIRKFSRKCKVCQSNLTSVIVPPTFYKELSAVSTVQLLDAMERKIRQANHLIFCGYSLPDADMHLKYVLKRAQINRRGQLEITVCNNHKDKDKDQHEEERRRFARFFGPDVNFTDLSFQDIANNPMMALESRKIPDLF